MSSAYMHIIASDLLTMYTLHACDEVLRRCAGGLGVEDGKASWAGPQPSTTCFPGAGAGHCCQHQEQLWLHQVRPTCNMTALLNQ